MVSYYYFIKMMWLFYFHSNNVLFFTLEECGNYFCKIRFFIVFYDCIFQFVFFQDIDAIG